jgi:preprotein translocase subunit YajC
MNLKALSFLLADAPASDGKVQDPRAANMQFFLLMAGMLVLMYFMMIRPQSKRAKEHATMVKALKAGDKVVTSGGVIGVVISVRERSLSLRSGDTKMEVLKSAVAEVDRSGTSDT